VEGHDNIKSCTSILDLIFRSLGSTYLGKTDFLHIKPVAPEPAGQGKPMSPETAGQGKPAARPAAPSTPAAEAFGHAMARDQAKRAGYTGESCGSCGSVRVRRNGTCIVCEDCGTTSGCS
jgi:ribonucleoside-diphosphate reductase alpha chain